MGLGGRHIYYKAEAGPHINTSLSNIFLTALLLIIFHQNCQAANSAAVP